MERQEVGGEKNGHISTASGSDCAMGGVLENTYGDPCMLLCLGEEITFYPDSSNEASYCMLRYPANISYCCQLQ